MVALDRPLLAYRAFQVRGGELYSLLSDLGRWGAGVKTARCEMPVPPGRRPAHQAPGRDCTCGNYGASTLALARRATAHTLRGHPLRRRKVVYGVVQLWGGDHDPVALDALRGGGVQVRAPFGQLVALVRSPLAGPVARRLGLPAIDEAVLDAYVVDLADALEAQLLTDELFVELDRPSRRQALAAELGRELAAGLRGLWWAVRHIARPVLICSLLLVAVPTWWALRHLVRRRLGWAAVALGGAALAVRTVVPPEAQALLVHAAVEWLRLLVGLLSIAFAVLLVLWWVLGEWVAAVLPWRRSR